MASLEAHEIYSRLHLGNEGDVDFYLRAAKGAKNILEIGCGWGRIASELLKAGHLVTGIDTNADFLAAARIESPAGSFELSDACDGESWPFEDGSFDRVLIPYNTLYALGGSSNVLRCLQAAEKKLTPEGELWFDVYPVDELHAHRSAGMEPEEEDDHEAIATWSDPLGPIDIFERTDFLPKLPALEVSYEAHQQGRCIGRLQMRHDYLPSHEIIELTESAGLTVLGLWGDFLGSPMTEEAEQLVFACGKAAES